LPRIGEGTLTERIKAGVRDQIDSEAIIAQAAIILTGEARDVSGEVLADLEVFESEPETATVSSYALLKTSVMQEDMGELNLTNLIRGIIQGTPGVVAVGYDTDDERSDDFQAFIKVNEIISRLGGFFAPVKNLTEALGEIITAIKAVATAV